MDERDDARRMADDLDSSRSRVTGHEVKHETPWLTFKHLTYEDPAGKTRKWDMVGRSTRAPNAVADAVCVFAVLRKSGEPNTTLLVRQFRPPLDAETIELPAGLVDGDESPEQTAIRELKEETGYVGVVAANAAHPRVVTPALPSPPDSPTRRWCSFGSTSISTIPSTPTRRKNSRGRNSSPCSGCRSRGSERNSTRSRTGDIRCSRGCTPWRWEWRWEASDEILRFRSSRRIRSIHARDAACDETTRVTR